VTACPRESWELQRRAAGDGDRDVEAAENIVRKASETPSTLKFLQGKVVVTDASWRLIAVEFEEQNTFGAMIRWQACVVFEWTSDAQYRWNALPSPALPCDVELQSANDLRGLTDGQKGLVIRRETAKQ
jgi:hypothetical protein